MPRARLGLIGIALVTGLTALAAEPQSAPETPAVGRRFVATLGHFDRALSCALTPAGGERGHCQAD
ncbi:MAG: hypothetical protein RQ833_06890 [Sphingomonadaceae bacterium]|nr:hypothetical protein [Sphingomonadaceae bacterium]